MLFNMIIQKLINTQSLRTLLRNKPMGSEYMKAKFILKRSSSGPNIVYSNSVVLQVCSPDQQHPPSPGNFLGMQILSLSLDLLNQKFYGQFPTTYIFISPAGDCDTCLRLRTTL